MLKIESSYTLFLILGASSLSCVSNENPRDGGNDRPNILWITCEDISPFLGCYGYPDAHTPNLDRLAEKGIRYTHAYANAPVCAPARSTLLTGMYASSTGSHEMRSRVKLPVSIPAYPKILRESGYYCTNNQKKDYNSSYENDTTLWDESSRNAHYRNRQDGQPFFAVFNIMATHQSQLSEATIDRYIERGLIPENPRINPADVKLPPYHPDLPEFREDWTRLHDLITLMDQMVGDILKELEEEGLEDNTIIFFYSDHGGNLARSKKFLYNMGTQVPFILYLPERWQHLSNLKPGTIESRLVSFVDFPKTALSLAGCNIPEIMQGRVFLGEGKEKGSEYVHFYRSRVSERWDFSRSVTDGRYNFIRNFMPHRPHGREIRYCYEVQAHWRAFERAYEDEKLNKLQAEFYKPKQLVELYDTEKDPWNIYNLVDSLTYSETIKKLSDELDRWMIETRDIGLIPEPMYRDLAGENRIYKTIYEYAQSNDFPVEKILKTAKISVMGEPDLITTYLGYMQDTHPVIRYWGAYGLFLTNDGGNQVTESLRKMIQDDSIEVNRLMAAQALGITGNTEEALNSIMKELHKTGRVNVFLFGLNALQFSHADKLMTLEDWKKLKDITFPDDKEEAAFAFHQRLINDAIELFPNRRAVD